MKCLPQFKLSSANGTVLHDWHAEVLAIRSLNHFILQECKAVLAAEIKKDDPDPYDSPYICRQKTKNGSNDDDDNNDNGGGTDGNQQQPFVWRENVTLHMYCSEAPCGDASMELTMSAQEDASPWESPLPPSLMSKAIGLSSTSSSPGMASSPATTITPNLLLMGRACFSHLGVVRRKPARPDAPPTLSKSCSDKLAMRQCISLLSSVVSLLVSPEGVYLSSLVLPESQYSAAGCERCFSAQGRMASLASANTKGERDGYAFRPFDIETTSLEFSFSKRGGRRNADGEVKYVASSLSTAWSANGLAENIIGGVLQGRKQTDPRGGSQVSRAKMWYLAKEIAEMVVGENHVAVSVHVPETYDQLKESPVLQGRRQMKDRVTKDALKGWVKNDGDGDFGFSIW